ncbi:MAG TPA: GntR family transcriptional regulator [Actinocrinis sp.]|nr:GntR family transcriptional regulator [Actinocrinis sp.]
MTSYREIADTIAESILSGEHQPGQRLAPVRDLAQSNGVSTKTAHAAVRELQARGLVTSRQGGTVVSPKLSVPTPTERLDRSLAGLGPLRPGETIRICSAGWADPVPSYVYDVLEVPEGDPVARREAVTEYDRRKSSLIVSWHPRWVVDLVPGLIGPDPITQGTIAAARAAGAAVGQSQNHFMARGADIRESLLLEVAEGAPVMAVVSLRAEREGRPIEYVECVYRQRCILSTDSRIEGD